MKQKSEQPPRKTVKKSGKIIGKYGFEFLSIFVAVVSAFALNNWNETRRDNQAAEKIIFEIYNGLEEDLKDVHVNMQGHKVGISACRFLREFINDRTRSQDSFPQYYFNMTRDYISVQNVSGYETLKSRGLELVGSDQLRTQIISLYEYDYSTLRKFEEEYSEMQFQASFFHNINDIVSPFLIFSSEGKLLGINKEATFTDKERSRLISYLWKIEMNRRFILMSYDQVEDNIKALQEAIENELK